MAVLPLTGTTNIFGVTRANFGTATFSANVIKYLNGTTFPGVIDPHFGVLTPTTSTGAAPGVGAAAGTNLTPSSTTTDFYGGWHARDLRYFEAITYHELKFIEAEAAFRAGDTQRAFDALRAGIRAHMVKVGAGGAYTPPAVTFPTITTAQINACLASAAVPQTPAAVTLRSIMEQKYLAMFFNPGSWSDMHRLDFASSIYVNFAYPAEPGFFNIGILGTTFSTPAAKYSPGKAIPITAVYNRPDNPTTITLFHFTRTDSMQVGNYPATGNFNTTYQATNQAISYTVPTTYVLNTTVRLDSHDDLRQRRAAAAHQLHHRQLSE